MRIDLTCDEIELILDTLDDGQTRDEEEQLMIDEIRLKLKGLKR